MKKFLLLLLSCFVLTTLTAAQISISVPNDTTTGTTLNKLAKFNTTGSATSVIISATTDTSGAIGIVTNDAATSNVAIVTISGVAPCVFDNSTTPNDYVQISGSTAGDCHDAGSTRPTSGQILGTVFGAGGSPGTYTVSLNKDIYPSASAAATAPLCSLFPASDTISAAGAFSTACAVPGGSLSAGSILDIEAHIDFNTNTTSSPLENFQINAGGTTGVCVHTGNTTLGISNANTGINLGCFIQVHSTGAPGTADAWGYDQPGSNPTGGGEGTGHMYELGGSLASFTTTTSQNITIQETATLVSGQTFQLISFVVRQY